jgi:hypothetical protein
MPRIMYDEGYRPNRKTCQLVNECNEILLDFTGQGYTLTVRQLYYQLVARDRIPNTDNSYKRLVSIVSRARDAGLIDWDHIGDRGRQIHSFGHWETGRDFLVQKANQFSLDWWKGQKIRCFVLVEKDALAEVVGRAASAYDTPYLACRGYPSATVTWDLARNWMLKSSDGCKHYRVLHLGDHDPSGIDMTRDLERRFWRYSYPIQEDKEEPPVIEVKRIALNMDQIQQFNPPPNPAKLTDPRAPKYIEEFGTDKSWELDALTPQTIEGLIREGLEEVLDMELFKKRKAKEERIQRTLVKTAKTLKV